MFTQNHSHVRLIFVLLISLLATANKAVAIQVETKQELIAGLIVFPPLAQQEEGDKCFGEVVSTLEKIFENSQYNLSIYCATPSRVYRDLGANLIDITVNVKTTSDLKQNVVFSKYPFVDLHVNLYSTRDRDPKVISSIGSFDYHGAKKELIDKGYTFFDTSSVNEAIVVFLRGRTDFLLSYERPMSFYVDSQSSPSRQKLLDLQYSTTPITTVSSFFAVRIAHPDAKKIMSVINNYMATATK